MGTVNNSMTFNQTFYLDTEFTVNSVFDTEMGDYLEIKVGDELIGETNERDLPDNNDPESMESFIDWLENWLNGKY